MKRIATLTAMILVCVAFSAADSVTITKGSGTLVGFAGPTYSFGFSGSGQGISVPFALSGFDGGDGLILCTPCDPRTTNMYLLHTGGIAFLGGNRFVQGTMDFLPVSFVSSLAPNGVLTVIYRATAACKAALMVPNALLPSDLILFPIPANSGTWEQSSRPSRVNTFSRKRSSQLPPFPPFPSLPL